LFKEKGINLNVDYGFKNTPGTPGLIEEMLGKSEKADMVVVDMTLTGLKSWTKAVLQGDNEEFSVYRVNKKDKTLSPNPNVLLETGFAWSQKGKYRTLFLMNEAFGAPSELPVDFSGLRHGITYNLNSDNYHEKKSKRNQLVKDLYKAITSSINSESSYQSEKWHPMYIGNNWGYDEYKNSRFEVTSSLLFFIKKIRHNLKSSTEPLRITGERECGKSRMIFHLFDKLSKELPADEISLHRVLYANWEDYGASLYPVIKKLAESNQTKVLVLDNCFPGISDKIKREYIKGAPISLIVIENNSTTEGDIHFDQSIKEEIIRTIITKRYLDSAVVGFCLQNANTIQKAIELVKEDLTPDMIDGYNTISKWTRLLGAELFSKGALEVLKFLSQFDKIGYRGRYSTNLDLLINQTGINRDSMLAILLTLNSMGYVVLKGDFVYIEPEFRGELFELFLSDKGVDYARDFISLVAQYGLMSEFAITLKGF
jgi:hypothetical protein